MFWLMEPNFQAIEVVFFILLYEQIEEKINNQSKMQLFFLPNFIFFPLLKSTVLDQHSQAVWIE